MFPAILGFGAHALGTRVTRHGQEHRHKLPWSTVVLSCICIGLIFGLMFSVLALKDRCSFNGTYLMGPSSLPIIVWLGLGICVVGWLSFLALSLLPSYRSQPWSLHAQEILVVMCQISVLMATGGLIYYAEYNVQFAQQYLVDGSEDSWGFGQILSLVSLIVPVMEVLQDGISHARGDRY